MLAFNSLICFPAFIVAGYFVFGQRVPYSFDPKDIPDSLTLFLQCLFCMLMEDIVFHISHRFLHWKVIYPYIHKLHHSYTTTVGIAAEYSHPIEYILGNVLASSMGVIILDRHVHITTSIVWGLIRIFETTDGHCGYEFSWSPFRLLPFGTSATYHDFHHSHNVGNYSSFFSIWDTIFGSNRVYYKYQQEREEK